MTIWQGLILNGHEVVNAPLIVGNTVFDTNDGRITFGHELFAASTQLGNDTTNAQMVLGLGTALGMQLIIGANAVMGNDYDHVPQTNPTLYVHSAINPNVDNTQWISIAHDQTYARVLTGVGSVCVGSSVPAYAVASGGLFVSGVTELTGTQYLVGSSRHLSYSEYLTTNSSNGVVWSFANVGKAWIKVAPTYDQMTIGVADGAGAGRQVILCDYATQDRDFDHVPQTHPTLFLHSSTDPDVNNTQWLSFAHVGTEAQAQTGVGGIVFYPASGVVHSNNYFSVTSGFIGRDGSGLFFGTAASVCGLYDAVTDTAAHSLKIGVAQATSNIVMVCQFNHNGSNPAIAAQTNPTLIVQSANAPAAQPTENVRIYHNQTNGVVQSAKGDLILDPATEITEVCGVGLKTKEYNATVNDEATISLPANTVGWGTVMAGDNQEFARFRWTSAAVVTVDESTANVATSDLDTNLCIFDGGTSVSIRNRLGSNLTIRYVIHYS